MIINNLVFNYIPFGYFLFTLTSINVEFYYKGDEVENRSSLRVNRIINDILVVHFSYYT